MSTSSDPGSRWDLDYEETSLSEAWLRAWILVPGRGVGGAACTDISELCEIRSRIRGVIRRVIRRIVWS